MSPFPRRNYRWELISACFLPFAIACVEGGVIGVLAQKAFLSREPVASQLSPMVRDLIVAVLTSAPALTNITSIFWTRILHGRDRVRATNLMQLAVLACVAVIACAPFTVAGVFMLVSAMLAARCFLTGIISARTDLWRANYPRHDRARVTGKLTIIVTLVVSMNALLIGAAMDIPVLFGDGADAAPVGGHAFRFVYALSIVLALVGVWAFSHVRMRRRAAHLRAEARHAAAGPEHPASARAMLRVLRNDKHYRAFMAAQFILGIPNLAATPVFVIALEDHFRLDYAPSIILTQVIPVSVVPILVIPLWARMLDRMHIIRFRVYHSWVFVFANLLMGVAFMADSLWLVIVSRIILGAAFGGGMLAWNLGHHDFASRELASIYMGIHVTLTGVRGVFAPFLGTLLYSGWVLTTPPTPPTPATPLSHFAPPTSSDLSSSFLDRLLHFEGLNWGAFFVLGAFSIAGAIMFNRLSRAMRHVSRAAPAHD